MEENVYIVNEINVLTFMLQTFFKGMLTVNVTGKKNSPYQMRVRIDIF